MWSKHGIEGASFGIAFYGDKGTLIIDDKGWRVEDGDEPAGGKPTERAGRAHPRTSSTASRPAQAPNADIEIGHMSTRLCHLGNIAHRVGRKLTFDAASESFPDDPEANKLLLEGVQREVRDALAGVGPL